MVFFKKKESRCPYLKVSTARLSRFLNDSRYVKLTKYIKVCTIFRLLAYVFLNFKKRLMLLFYILGVSTVQRHLLEKNIWLTMFANIRVKHLIDVIFVKRVLPGKNTLWTMWCGIQEKLLITVKPVVKNIQGKNILLIICAHIPTTHHFVVKYVVSDLFVLIFQLIHLCRMYILRSFLLFFY